MAQTQSHQLPPSQSFPPPASSPSPGAPSPVSGVAPPLKRQRLSPHPQPQSPYASPAFGTPQPPQSSGSPVNGMSVNGMANALASAPAGSMGPPSRPPEKDKPTDTAELTDVLASSGIDVREEEANLTRSYANPATQSSTQHPHPQQINVNTSFSQGTPGIISPATSFNDPSQSRQPQFQSFYDSSNHQPPEVAPEEEKLRDDTQAGRREQYHLQASFLLSKLLEQKLQKRGIDLGIRMPSEGLYHPVPGRPQPIEVSGPDGSSVVRKGQTILDQENAPLVDILSIVSLGCEERLRTVIDESATLAFNRRKHSHGLVPLEWNDLAVANELSNTATPQTVPLKRTNSTANDQDTGCQPTDPPIFAQRARKVMGQDSSYEEGRAAKRARRSANAILGSDSVRSGSVGPSTPGATTPAGPVSEKAPAPEVEKKTNKKEMKKQAEAKATEAVQHQHAVETARMATNSLTSGVRFGGKRKEYSWLKKPAIGGSGFSTPSRINTNVSSTNPDSAGTTGGTSGAKSGRSTLARAARGLGDWREDGEKGSGIQVRDVLVMLELEGRGLKNVQRAYSTDAKEDKD